MLILNDENLYDAMELISTRNWTGINGMIKSAPVPENPLNTITFCEDDGFVKVGTDVKRYVLLFLHGTHKTSFFVHPFTSEKYEVKAGPSSGELDPENDRAVIVDISLRMFCTTVVDLEIPFLFWRDEYEKYRRMVEYGKYTNNDVFVCPLRSRIQCELSRLLDPDCVKWKDKMEKLGRGSTSIVYKGKYRGQDVACKIPRYEDEDEEHFKQFSDEAKAIAGIPPHMCIVNFFGAVSVPGCHCLVTEFCPFGSLLASMRKNKDSWTIEMKVKAMYDCACAMNFLHQNNIIHRDLKLENLLVVSLDPRSQVVCKLSDFGSSTRKIETITNTRFTMTGDVGTSCFMAPEMLEGEKCCNKVDVFSFGITVAGTIDGTQPYEGFEFTSLYEFQKGVIEGMRPTVKNARRMPSDFVKLMEECWVEEPKQRPPFDIIVDRLEIILDSLRR